MPLDQNDRDVIRSIFREELQPIRDQVHNHEQTLYGAKGDSGVRKYIGDLEGKVEKLEIFRTQVKTIGFTVLPAVQISFAVAAEWIKSKFK